MPPIRPTILALTLAGACSAAVARSEAPSMPDVQPFNIPAPPLAERVAGLSTLWSEAKFSFAYFDQAPDLDWDAAHQQFIPRVIAAETMYAYYNELKAFMALLNDGHTDVSMPDSIQMDSVPLALEPIDGRYFVARADINLARDVPAGSEIVSVRGIDTHDYVQTEIQPYIAQSTPHARALWSGLYLLRAAIGQEVTFEVVTPEGVRREVTASANRYTNFRNTRYEPPFPSFQLGVEWPAEGIAKVMVPTFMGALLPAQFAQFVPELQKADAIIIDLRYNTGGMTSNAQALLEHITDRNLKGSRWTTREHRAAHRVWGANGTPSLEAYGRLDAWTEPENLPEVVIDTPGALSHKPIAVLTSTYTGSTAEDFLIYADTLKNVTRIGSATYGSTGQPLPIDLPGGGSARICTKRDTWPDGTDFVGVGIQPHIHVPLTADDLRTGFDRTLDVAIEHLTKQLNTSQSHEP